MICKVQISIFGKPATLIYNEDRSFMWEDNRTVGEKVLGKALKGFFHVTTKNTLRGTKIIIGKKAPVQDW